MQSKLPLQDRIDKTLEMTSDISKVQAPLFFKGKVLNKLFVEKESNVIFEWFTPKLQLATLACVLVLNIYALIQYNQNNYDAQVSDFAETYTLTSYDSDSLFN